MSGPVALLVGPPGPGPWCVPGCRVLDTWDHQCVALVGTVARTAGPAGEPRAIAVEVDREADGRRVVVLTAVDPVTRRYDGDPIALDAGRLAELAALLAEAERLAR